MNAPARRNPDAPSLGVLAAAGFGVLAVVVFVWALAMGATNAPRPGELVRVVGDGGPGGMAVLAGRCADQRVTSVEVVDPAGKARWRIESDNGSIDRRYPVGAPPPLGFRVVTALRAKPAGAVRAVVTFDRNGITATDARMVDVAGVKPALGELAAAAPPCASRRGLGGTTLPFALAAVVVVGGYVVMLTRFMRAGR